jgi:AraC family transcriptional regulator
LLPTGVEVPEEFDILTIPSSKWVAFSENYETVEETSQVIGNLWKRIFTEWFPNSEYEITTGPQLEVYPNTTRTVEVWIPIVKKV